MNSDILDGAKALVDFCDKPCKRVSMMANLSSLLYWNLEDVNWVGFYLLDDEDLVLGPFSGQVACQVLKKGHGVCQKALELGKSLVVEDVSKFPGHIACDSNSKSEAVVPLKDDDGNFFGVIDVDSPVVNRFNASDIQLLEDMARLVEKAWGSFPYC